MTRLGQFLTDEEQIARSDALLAAIVRSASDAIIAMDAGGTIISWNRGAQLHFGFAERDMIGLSATRFIPPDCVREHETALSRVFAGELVPQFHSVRTTCLGVDLTVSVAMSPIHGPDDSVAAVSAILRPRHAARKKSAADEQASLWDGGTILPERDQDGAVADDACRILVVEDEALIGLGLASMLENAGFTIIGPVADLKTAMSILDREDPALAILDINLAHGETSAPLAERLKSCGIPFLVTSGNKAAAGRGIFGTAPTLPKPVGARRLVEAVQQALA